MPVMQNIHSPYLSHHDPSNGPPQPLPISASPPRRHRATWVHAKAVAPARHATDTSLASAQTGPRSTVSTSSPARTRPHRMDGEAGKAHDSEDTLAAPATKSRDARSARQRTPARTAPR
ncbi:hypothetical protein OPT61_g9411 [Boeremia exigua]|uniref:Uncharacterized protein n=1 Tax=Boeremia exigua TaxID=749465 RepID=A0ACC2HUZ9_9PLEO|nr:hypothetical protein OPT61_g9411 [Boeremia exigua]